jgi:NAD(P)H-hydrate repair Nnr-like enzyme with NAD(P)H-hydrate epimerase domain
MSRNGILVIGALLWTAVAVDTGVHLALGEWMAPAVAAILAVAFVAWRRARRPVPEAA